MAGCGAVGSALPWGGRGRGFKSRHSDQIRTAILIQNCGSVFLPENAAVMGFLKKEKFQRNGWFAKIRAFSAIAHKFRSLRNFSSKNNAPLSPVFR